MYVEEHAAKPLLAAAGIDVPTGRLCRSVAEAKAAAEAIGPSVIKAQIAGGRRGKAGGIEAAKSPRAAEEVVERMLGSTIDGQKVETVLVEAETSIAREFYAAVFSHQETKGPLLLFSTEGGMAIDDITRDHADKMAHLPVDIRDGVDDELLEHIFGVLGLDDEKDALVEFFLKLYDAYRVSDAELIEINPLALTTVGDLVALDCTLALDPSGAARRPDIALAGMGDMLNEREMQAKEQGLDYIELDGNIGVLANGAGLAMATMDVITHYGGRPANFLAIADDAYGKAKPAMDILLANPKLKSLVIHLCGTAGRSDLMAEQLLDALAERQPACQVVFSVHGMGEADANTMIREKIGIVTFNLIDHAAEAAVEAAA